MTRSAVGCASVLFGQGHCEDGDKVNVTVSRETAEWMAQLVDARVNGQEVMLTNTRSEVTPTQAGHLLGMSRPQVRKLMNEGNLDFRRVGTHYRITVSSIRGFLDAESADSVWSIGG